MKNGLTLILFWLPMLLWSQVSIYDIQYTTDAGADWTYPSPYAGQAVTTEGIVTVANVQGGRYYLSAEEGGAWNGIYIYDTNNKPSVGDKVRLRGTVYEYKGYTEITSVTSFDVLSTSNALPPGAEISSIRVDDEAYEGVLVKVTDCRVTSTYDTYGNWGVDSGSGQCVIRSGIYNAQGDGVPLFLNYPFESVTGIVAQYYGVCLLPRNREDLVSAEGGFILSFDDLDADGKKNVDLSIDVMLFSQTDDINSYELNMTYDATSFSYEGYSTEGAITPEDAINDHSTPGNINLTFSGNVSCSDTKQLIVLKFKPLKIGSANLQFTSSRINGNNHPYLKSGNLFCSYVACDAPQADMVTVVQRPLFNIPSIVKPGEVLNIECFAPQSTTDWDAELIYDNHVVDLNITQADYDSHLEKWTLQALVPTVEFYELYDLHVRASGGISDVTNNSVKVIKQYKDEYYFIQITDLHLLGHTFWGEEGYKEDNTEMDDLREVIDDINLLQPEFVLITGDLINEGEMEEFECLRNHTRTIELLEEFEVPVYVVPGNHDLGGWVATPPVQGTARKDWWRFFGWNHPNGVPEREEYYVHDYSFDYGNVHFVGLESSDNYDAYMHDVYGDKGFISSQLNWLENDLAAAGNKTKVLFYHFDFNHDLDLTTLGADMALWGHTHKNTDDFTHPYNIGTDNVCDETQAYRVIRVNNGALTPLHTLYAQNHQQNLEISYSDENNGSHDLLTATISNKHNQSFSNTLVKFEMPGNIDHFIVENGTLEQVVEANGYKTCYVKVNLEANSTQTVTIKKDVNNGLEALEAHGGIGQAFPNPFKEQVQIDYVLNKQAQVQLYVYNLSGQLINTLVNNAQEPDNYSVLWDGTSASGSKVTPGIYFFRYLINGKQVASRRVILTR